MPGPEKHVAWPPARGHKCSAPPASREATRPEFAGSTHTAVTLAACRAYWVPAARTWRRQAPISRQKARSSSRDCERYRWDPSVPTNAAPRSILERSTRQRARCPPWMSTTAQKS